MVRFSFLGKVNNKQTAPACLLGFRTVLWIFMLILLNYGNLLFGFTWYSTLATRHFLNAP